MVNIDVYYESIKQVYDQIINWRQPNAPIREKIIDIILVFMIFLFVFSFVPILPSLFIIIGGYAGLSLFTIVLKDATIINFVIIWIISAVISLILMLIMIFFNSKVDELPKENTKPPQSLSAEQNSFIAIYESYKELKIYFVSHIEQHIDKSLKALERLLDYFPSIENRRDFENIMIQGDEFPRYVNNNATEFMVQVHIASSFLETFEKYDWFELEPRTKAIFQALISFSQKIPYRLEEKQDLPRVLGILENLSGFTYAFLPEHKTYMEEKDLQDLHSAGINCLNMFVREINDLTIIKPPEKHEESKHRLPSKIIEIIKKLFSENIFFRFIIWFILILVLTSGAVALINLKLTLSPDTMATIIIGTSVASSAALASFLPKKPK